MGNVLGPGYNYNLKYTMITIQDQYTNAKVLCVTPGVFLMLAVRECEENSLLVLHSDGFECVNMIDN